MEFYAEIIEIHRTPIIHLQKSLILEPWIHVNPKRFFIFFEATIYISIIIIHIMTIGTRVSP